MEPVDTWTMIGIWIGVGLTFCMYSFLYKDNPIFKFAEHLYVGIAAGYGLCVTWFRVLWPDLILPLLRILAKSSRPLQRKIPQWLHDDFGIVNGEMGPLKETDTLLLLIPLILGLMLLTRVSKKLQWISRYPFAMIIGGGAGIAIPLVISATFFKQLEPAVQSVVAYGPAGELHIADTVGRIVILIGTISVLVYFFFSVHHKGAVKVVAKIGILYLMIAFGAAFGLTVMARESLLIGRVRELIEYSGKEYHHATIIMGLVVLALVVTLGILGRRAARQETKDR